MKHSKRGVTLVELMVVLCLVMLLASLAFINFSFLNETATHAEVTKLHALFFMCVSR
jgi:Tfp pilus assembly protein FimT